MWAYETRAHHQGFDLIVGIDEAGRGPLAGPVVAAAVSLKDKQFTCPINDSKQLTPLMREQAFLEIYNKAHIGIGIMNEQVIDAVNILQATFLAMSQAVGHLMHQISPLEPPILYPALSKRVCLLIDGPYFKTDLPFKYQTIIQGDRLSFSIACASIVAKVIRDRILNIYDQVFPNYGFKKHKGYPTKQHQQAIRSHGFSLIHRKSFRVNSF